MSRDQLPLAPPAILDRIVEGVVRQIADEQKQRPLSELRAAISRRPADFRRRLLAAPPPRIIAEIKRQSPSAGAIAPQADPVATAADYLTHGAVALSVLTERE